MTEWLAVIASFIAAGGAVAACIVSAALFRASRLPEVVVFLDRNPSGATYDFVVSNIGASVAYDIHIDTGSLPIRGSEKQFFARFSSEIPMLPPGSSRRTSIWEAGHSAGSQIHDVRVSYSSKRNGKPTETIFPLEYRTLQHELYCQSDLQLLRKAVEKIANQS